MDVTLDAGALQAFLRDHFPQVETRYHVESVAPMRLVVRMPVSEQHLRPGGTVSGPSMFALADVSVYLAVLAMIGPEALAVTTSCHMDFMRKPAAGRDLIAETRLLKLGRALAVGDVLIHSDGTDAPVARASLTYSIPPRRA
ncbi:PaaI family thioesterase [Palleronia sp. KMU-117]|uniref:PaaI family thioesterase n=1 Tax=Palleronia sp. KMU-117 TaxID=3434108 RepID=UPI003D728CF6